MPMLIWCCWAFGLGPTGGASRMRRPESGSPGPLARGTMRSSAPCAPRGALWPALRWRAMADDALLEVEVSGYTLHGDDPKTVRSRPLDAPVSIDQPAIAVSRTQLTLCVCVGPAIRIARPLLLCDAAG